VGSFTNGCESDYALTRLVGEPFNTLAALVIVGIGLFGLYHCAPPGHELRTRATYLALALLGAHPHPRPQPSSSCSSPSQLPSLVQERVRRCST
jgi:hypothetical protein